MVRGGHPFGTLRVVSFRRLRRGLPVRRFTLVGTAIAAIGAGVLLTACSPLQIGAAAIVGNQRITEAALDSDGSNLEATASQHPSEVTITSAEMPSAVLNWLFPFQLYDKMASQAGIT